jgi:hypothetical protein
MQKIAILLIGIIEIFIGLATLIGCFSVQTWGVLGLTGKPGSVYIFVVVTATISLILGIGIIFGREWAKKLLLFFSGYVILTKVLQFLGLLVFKGQIITVIPSQTKDIISIVYHIFLIGILLYSYRGKSTQS